MLDCNGNVQQLLNTKKNKTINERKKLAVMLPVWVPNICPPDVLSLILLQSIKDEVFISRRSSVALEG